MATVKGKAPGGDAGEMSARTLALRPRIAMKPEEIRSARTLRRHGHEPEAIAASLSIPLEEIEKALLQMRSPRPETTRGTLNITLTARKLVARERKGNEPMWQTFDRLLGELLTLRGETAEKPAGARDRGAPRKPPTVAEGQGSLPI